MARYDFVSPGAAAAQSIQQFLVQRALAERQAMLDAATQRQQQEQEQRQRAQLDLQQRQETRVAADSLATRQALQGERDFRRATTIANAALPDDPADQATRDLLTKEGYGGQLRTVPGIVAQGPMTTSMEDDPEGIPRYGVIAQPDTYAMRGGSQYLSARAAEEARAAQARDANQSREGIAELNAQQRADAAEARLANARTNTEIAMARMEFQKAQADLKIEAANKDRDTAKGAIATARADVRDLAQSILDDPALESITGPIEGRRDTFVRAGNVDVLARLTQLLNKLSLESRSKMKGQGAVSDFEGRMLASSVSAINRAAGPDNVKKHLREIIAAFEGDTPKAGAATNDDALLDELLKGTSGSR